MAATAYRRKKTRCLSRLYDGVSVDRGLAIATVVVVAMRQRTKAVLSY